MQYTTNWAFSPKMSKKRTLGGISVGDTFTDEDGDFCVVVGFLKSHGRDRVTTICNNCVVMFPLPDAAKAMLLNAV